MSSEKRPGLVGRIAENARRFVAKNTEQNPERKAAKKIFKGCDRVASYIKVSFAEHYEKIIPNYYLDILLSTALRDAVFNCFYRNEDMEDPPEITRIPLADKVFSETDRLLGEKRLKMYDAILPYTRNFKKRKPEITVALISFYRTEVLPKAQSIAVDYKEMLEMGENGIRQKLAFAIDKSIVSLLRSSEAKELGIAS